MAAKRTLKNGPGQSGPAKVTSPLRGANAIRHKDAQVTASVWQGRATDKWSIPRHSNKSASDIARLIAKPGENPNTIRRRIKKPI